MKINAKELAAEASYKLMTGIIVPRPIAWVTTVSPQGVVNLAPFSHFTFVAPKPPMVAISIGRKGNADKDTARNVLANEEFVVHIANVALLGPLHQSSSEYPADVSEIDILGLETEASDVVAPPRLKAAPIALECQLRHCLELGESRNRLLIGEVVMIYIADGLMRDGRIDSRELDPICRLAGPNYASLGEILTMKPVLATQK